MEELIRRYKNENRSFLLDALTIEALKAQSFPILGGNPSKPAQL
jgi:hypothetical protein